LDPIHQVDGLPYATVRDVAQDVLYLIRFDQNNVEWIAQLPLTPYLNAAAFTPLTGEFWVGGSRKMWRFEHLNQLTGYATALEATASRDWSSQVSGLQV
jgi:hypothetical protein